MAKQWTKVATAAVLALLVAGCASTSETMSADEKKSDAVSSNGDAAKVDDRSKPTTSTVAEEDKKIEIVETGFANLPPSSEYDDPTATAAAIVKNPTTGWVANSVSVQITFYDAAGAVLKSSEQTISTVLPGATVGISAAEDGLTGVANVEVQARPSDWERAEGELGALSVSGVNIRPQEYGGVDVNGVVTSTVGSDLEQVEVQVIFRDEAGKAVGGTFTYLDFVPANGTSPFTVSTYNDVPPGWTAEGYAVPSFLTMMAASNDGADGG